MDEADILGDRIAIMTEGEVECTGSSLFLKQRYGVGYQLIIEKAVQEDLPEVEEYLKSEIPDIMKLQEVSGEISF
jgi:ATP-binding cassette subfamily A (ABC1) protein 3